MATDFAFPEFIRNHPEVDLPVPGARGWILQGEATQAVFLEFDEDVHIPDHSHAEQWELPVAGQVDLHRAGETRTYGAGDIFFVPAGQVHRADVRAGYKAIVFFNAPDRYKPKAG